MKKAIAISLFATLCIYSCNNSSGGGKKDGGTKYYPPNSVSDDLGLVIQRVGGVTSANLKIIFAKKFVLDSISNMDTVAFEKQVWVEFPVAILDSVTKKPKIDSSGAYIVRKNYYQVSLDSVYTGAAGKNVDSLMRYLPPPFGKGAKN